MADHLIEFGRDQKHQCLTIKYLRASANIGEREGWYMYQAPTNTHYVSHLNDSFSFRNTKAKGDVLTSDMNLDIDLRTARELFRV